MKVPTEIRVEERTRSGHPRYVWKLPSGQRNEALDMMNQAHAGAIRLGVTYWTDEEWDMLAERLSKLEKPVQGDLEDLINPVAGEQQPATADKEHASKEALIAAARQRAERARRRNT